MWIPGGPHDDSDSFYRKNVIAFMITFNEMMETKGET